MDGIDAFEHVMDRLSNSEQRVGELQRQLSDERDKTSKLERELAVTRSVNDALRESATGQITDKDIPPAPTLPSSSKELDEMPF